VQRPPAERGPLPRRCIRTVELRSSAAHDRSRRHPHSTIAGTVGTVPGANPLRCHPLVAIVSGSTPPSTSVDRSSFFKPWSHGCHVLHNPSSRSRSGNAAMVPDTEQLSGRCPVASHREVAIIARCHPNKVHFLAHAPRAALLRFPILLVFPVHS
jgi:hypothetical protein